jgi:hypothetical protein
MTDDRQPPDYSELLRSPYDPDPDAPSRKEGESDLPWVPAVIAASIGALVVSAFVVVSLIRGPAEDDVDVAGTATTSTTLAPEPSEALPPGFTSIDPDTGVAVEGVKVTGRATAIAIATAVRGGLDPGDVPAPEIAYWELRSGGAESPMSAQYGERGAIGNITVEFPPVTQLRRPELVAHPAEGADEQVATLDIPATFGPSGSVSDYRIDLGDGRAVVIDEVTVGDGWGFVTWHTVGPSPATVSTVVTFVGTDDPASTDVVDPTLLTSAHLRTIGQGTGARPLPPMYNFTGSEPLVRSGEPLSESNAPEAISIAFTVRVPASIGDPVVVDVPGSG